MIYYNLIKTPTEHYSVYGKQFFGFVERHRGDGYVYNKRINFYIQGIILSRISMSKENKRRVRMNDIT